MKKNLFVLIILLIICCLPNVFRYHLTTMNEISNVNISEERIFQTKEIKTQETEQMNMTSRSHVPYFRLSDTERKVVECIVQGEAGGESYKGKLLVAQCILNACLESNIQPSEVRIQFKYSGWKENVSDDTRKAVYEVFDNGYKVVDEPILYFYAPKYCTSKWHETQTHVITEGGHKFFKRNQ